VLQPGVLTENQTDIDRQRNRRIEIAIDPHEC
jgi:flagellar motor protein MotB